MQLKEKKEFIKNFKEEIKNSESFIITKYQGLDVNTINELRNKLKGIDCRMKVIKNRLAKRVFEEMEISEVSNSLNGPTAILFGGADPSPAIKIFSEFIKQNKLMKFKAAVISGNFYDGMQIEKLAELPSRDVMLQRVVCIFNAPIQGFYCALSASIGNFINTLNDLKKKRETESRTETGNPKNRH